MTPSLGLNLLSVLLLKKSAIKPPWIWDYLQGVQKIIYHIVFYRVTNVATVSLRGYSPDEEKVTEIRKLLSCGTFYFAWSRDEKQKPIDLTLSAQKSVKFDKNDNRFFWNRMLYIPFVRYGIETDNWLLKVNFNRFLLLGPYRVTIK